jgi:Holliday junction resolvasome RuvABC DNA-binding subunit
MSPTIANVVVQIASQSNHGAKASTDQVISGLQRLGYEEDEIREVLNDAEQLGFVRQSSGEVEILGAG